MYPILYESVTIGTVPSNYGVGVLKDAIECKVKEVRNGEYELTLKYPSSGAYANMLIPRAVLKVKPNFTDDPQLFRIYKIGKEINSSFTVYARHISYDLSGFPITSGTATNLGDALTLLENNANGYTIDTDKSLNANFSISEPSSVRSWFGGKSGSILDIYGPGEWKYDNFSIHFLANRGQDRGVTIRYGKNLTKLTNTDDSSSLATGILAYWKSTDDAGTTVISNVISTGATLDVLYTDVIDASDRFENQPTVSQLDNYVNSYISSHKLTSVSKNVKLDFAQINKLLKDRVDLCDMVHIIYEDYNINMTAKCISTTWDVISEKYTEIELGEARTNIADTIVSVSKAAGEAVNLNQVKQAVTDATDLITGNRGGYVILHDSDGDNRPDELLIMNTSDIATATKVWRWNLSGLGYSKTGYNGTYGTAMTMEGAIVADYIKSGNLVFGGSGNADGKLEIQDTHGNIICRFDKTGADVKGNITAESFVGDASMDWMGQHKVYTVKIAAEASSLPLGSATTGMHEYDSNNSPRAGFGINGGDAVTSYVKSASNSDNDFSMAYMRTIPKGLNYTEFGAYHNGKKGFIARAKGSAGNSTLNVDGVIYCVKCVQSSSEKVKTNIEDLTEEEAKKVLELRPVSFDYKDGNNLDRRGFIAEEVQKLLPNLVCDNVTEADEDLGIEESHLLSLDYISIIPYLVKMVQMQQAQIEELQDSVTKLKGDTKHGSN